MRPRTAPYIRRFMLDDDRRAGEAHGMAYAERFYYQGPADMSALDAYIAANARPL